MPRPSELIPGFRPTRTWRIVGGGLFEVTVTPPPLIGGTPQSVLLNRDQFERYESWLRGEGLIQEVLSDLTADQREILVTGLAQEDFLRPAHDNDD